MKKLILLIIVTVCLSKTSIAQTNFDPGKDCDLATNISCSSAIMLCDDYSETLLTNPPGCDCVFGLDEEWFYNSVYRPKVHHGQIVGGEYFAYWNAGLFYSFY